MAPTHANRASCTAEQTVGHERTNGIDRAVLDGTGSMVVSTNGTVASLAVTEFPRLGH